MSSINVIMNVFIWENIYFKHWIFRFDDPRIETILRGSKRNDWKMDQNLLCHKSFDFGSVHYNAIVDCQLFSLFLQWSRKRRFPFTIFSVVIYDWCQTKIGTLINAFPFVGFHSIRKRHSVFSLLFLGKRYPYSIFRYIVDV